MIRKILVAVAIVVAALLAYATTRPERFHVERSADIAAAPATIYALIDDFHAWPQWSPYEKLDPAMQRQFDGPVSGVGAGYGWNSDGKAGAGHMTMTDASAPSRIVIQLDFTKPFAARNIATFTLQPERASTHVTWAMDGPSPYIAKLMGIFFNMDTTIGRDFEQGLAQLKSVAEASAAGAPALP